jgi:hypothetical protein
VNEAAFQCESCPFRRIVFIEIDHSGTGHLSKAELFSFDTIRTPICFMDVNTSTGEILKVEQVGTATAWMDVPTPAI